MNYSKNIGLYILGIRKRVLNKIALKWTIILILICLKYKKERVSF